MTTCSCNHPRTAHTGLEGHCVGVDSYGIACTCPSFELSQGDRDRQDAAVLGQRATIRWSIYDRHEDRPVILRGRMDRDTCREYAKRDPKRYQLLRTHITEVGVAVDPESGLGQG